MKKKQKRLLQFELQVEKVQRQPGRRYGNDIRKLQPAGLESW
jgi:hypothetical protein